MPAIFSFQFIRLPETTAPSSVWNLLRETWNLDLPKLIISVVGGKDNFKFPRRLQEHFKNGLWKVFITCTLQQDNEKLPVGVPKKKTRPTFDIM